MASDSVEWYCQKIDEFLAHTGKDSSYAQSTFNKKIRDLASREGRTLHGVDCILECILNDVDDHWSNYNAPLLIIAAF